MRMMMMGVQNNNHNNNSKSPSHSGHELLSSSPTGAGGGDCPLSPGRNYNNRSLAHLSESLLSTQNSPSRHSQSQEPSTPVTPKLWELDFDYRDVKGVYKNCRGIWAAQWTDEKGQRHTKYFNPKFFSSEAAARVEAYKFKVKIQLEVEAKGGGTQKRRQANLMQADEAERNYLLGGGVGNSSSSSSRDHTSGTAARRIDRRISLHSASNFNSGQMDPLFLKFHQQSTAAAGYAAAAKQQYRGDFDISNALGLSALGLGDPSGGRSFMRNPHHPFLSQQQEPIDRYGQRMGNDSNINNDNNFASTPGVCSRQPVPQMAPSSASMNNNNWKTGGSSSPSPQLDDLQERFDFSNQIVVGQDHHQRQLLPSGFEGFNHFVEWASPVLEDPEDDERCRNMKQQYSLADNRFSYGGGNNAGGQPAFYSHMSPQQQQQESLVPFFRQLGSRPHSDEYGGFVSEAPPNDMNRGQTSSVLNGYRFLRMELSNEMNSDKAFEESLSEMGAYERAFTELERAVQRDRRRRVGGSPSPPPETATRRFQPESLLTTAATGDEVAAAACPSSSQSAGPSFWRSNESRCPFACLKLADTTLFPTAGPAPADESLFRDPISVPPALPTYWPYEPCWAQTVTLSPYFPDKQRLVAPYRSSEGERPETAAPPPVGLAPTAVETGGPDDHHQQQLVSCSKDANGQEQVVVSAAVAASVASVPTVASLGGCSLTAAKTGETTEDYFLGSEFDDELGWNSFARGSSKRKLDEGGGEEVKFGNGMASVSALSTMSTQKIFQESETSSSELKMNRGGKSFEGGLSCSSGWSLPGDEDGLLEGDGRGTGGEGEGETMVLPKRQKMLYENNNNDS